ncbi:acetyltransferase [Chromohalobacter japonicus]|uniref:Acetyltransferase n=1 Tax=Chromohalobacter japonicus TaxID=223900 RepID=A0A1Q8T978_9GAMM|nr:acetyltransferase [Chromohalobacter japonicus]OLO10227.1 acetyltransferase [Chromohalobacter japonicus]
MIKLAILGASGHGKVIADTALQAGWAQVVFFDDAWPEVAENGSWSVVGDSSSLFDRLSEFDGVVVGIGNNRVRLEKTRALQSKGAKLTTIIHPRAAVSDSVKIGAGSVILAGSVIQVDSELGVACIVNTSASIDHDCFLGDGVHVCPGAAVAGSVRVGEGSWIGIGSSIKQLVKIGYGVTVGAGAAVIRDVQDDQVVVGVPAAPVTQ